MLRIKEQYKNTVIAFQNSGVSLSKRTDVELIDLALLAHSSGDEMIKNYFEHLPSVPALNKMKMTAIIANQVNMQ